MSFPINYIISQKITNNTKIQACNKNKNPGILIFEDTLFKMLWYNTRQLKSILLS